jgi:hypothetical protein
MDSESNRKTHTLIDLKLHNPQSNYTAGAVKPACTTSILNWLLDFNPPIYHSFREAV